MSYLYRHALFVTRKQPYRDWANSLDNDGVELSEELSRQQREVYLVPETDAEPALDALLGEFWEDIFEAELSSWVLAEERWPQSRTRELFDEWFDVELNHSVYDLTPEEPLTQRDVDLADLSEATATCAACGMQIDAGEGRFVGFTLADRRAFKLFEGRVIPLPIEDEEAVLCIVSPEDSDDARAGDDVLVMACSSRCEKGLRKIVPRALKAWPQRLEAQ
jgi:hypothetical protein